MKNLFLLTSTFLFVVCSPWKSPYDPDNPEYVYPFFKVDSTTATFSDNDTITDSILQMVVGGNDVKSQFRWRLDSTSWSNWVEKGTKPFIISIGPVDSGLHTFDIQTCYNPNAHVADSTFKFYRALLPSISAMCDTSFHHSLNQSCTLWVKASGTAPLSYLWFRNSAKTSFKNDTLILNAATEDQSGLYWCKVSNHWQTVYSDSIWVTVEDTGATDFIKDSLSLFARENSLLDINLRDSCFPGLPQTLTFHIIATNSGRDSLYLSGRYTFLAGYIDSGHYRVSAYITDGTRNDTFAIGITVKNVNRALTITLQEPVNGAKGIARNTLFKWNGSDPGGGRLTYTLYLGTLSNQLEVVYTGKDNEWQGASNLNSGNNYYYKVSVTDGIETVESSTRTFSTNNIPTVVLSTPENGNTGTGLPLTLGWNGNDIDAGDNSILRYTVYIDTNANPSIPVLSDLSNSNTDISGLLSYDKKYYWKVSVTDSKDTGTSNTWTFTTVKPAGISLHPINDTLKIPDGSASFTITAIGSGNIQYQWLKNGINIPKATSSALIITSGNHGDKYRCVVSNGAGTLDTSNEATLSLAYKISTTKTGNGVISPESTYVVQGQNQIFSFNPQQGSVISHVGIDNLTAAIFSVCTLKAVSSLHTVKCDFLSVLPLLKKIPSKNKSFTMGSTWTVNNEHLTPHTVNFTYDFYMDSTHVTQKDYKSFMNNENPASPTGCVGDQLPISNITWYDAILYCNARSKNSGFDTVYTYTAAMGTPGNGCVLSDVNIHYDRIGYRLPTEAEWEFAYRANTTTDFYWGMTFSDNMTALDSAEFDLYTVWKHNGGACPSPVATKFPNAFGLYDMSGNVVHLCNDWKCAYSSTPLTDPIGAESGTKIVWRGSSFEQPFPVWSTAFARWTGAAPDFKYISIGFRCVIVSK